MSAIDRLRALHRWLVPPDHDQGAAAYVWLIYFSFFFVEWWFRPVGPVELTLSALTVLAFLALYFSAWRRRGGVALAHVLGLVALGAAWTPYNAGASTLFIYGASFAYRVGPPRKSFPLVLGIVMFAALVAVIGKPALPYWLPGIFISLMIGGVNIYFAERERHNAELRLNQAEVRRLARTAERERIARDLHDVLGHTLSLITVKSELAGRLLDRDPARARSELQSIEQTARRALADVRGAISGLHEQRLEDALEQARLSLRAADVELKLDCDDSLAPDPRTQAMLALVIREAVTNILRHAGARNCWMRLTRDEHGVLRLEIEDDGRGGLRPDGGGVQGMRARIESLGGELQIGQGPGTRLIAHVPLRGPEGALPA